ncbi:sulfite exporter TauE/SafE family protein [Streptomyces sp. NBC_01808]|uniref:sulfite exporter TauE/SafE family protein n=1 Tax=Streptomyces sp. NBC_01808 TaxID=2975947 RepID=UPI002DDA2590|nr:sulfite exporter TauE/SafE family protein [Streptomyces sp. NBC_01808]WSA36031.1 sulfite exporter TauE/SafE family protein [Streptomyces sp. NBC_01808]
MTLTGYLVIAVAVVIASCLQASIGFGMGMFAAPVVALVDPALIPGTLIMLAAMVTVLVTMAEREHIDLRGTGWALVGRVPGTVAGALLVAALPARGLALLLAGVVLFGVVLASFGWAPSPRRQNLVLAGSASGLLGTATSIGGPPMALVWQGKDGPMLRGTMSGFFLIGSVLSVGMLALTGSLGTDTVVMAALLTPGPLLGYALSRHVNRLLDKRRLRWSALVMSALGAVLLIGSQVI